MPLSLPSAISVMVVFIAALLAGAPVTLAAKRVALVIGIDGYHALPPLQKAVGDARALAVVLRNDLGFTVIDGENLTRSQMARKLAELDGGIAVGDTVLFFFAGHGVALSTSENILLPSDIASPGPGQEGLVRDNGFAVDGIVRRIQNRGAAVTVMILDACRDNPFEQAGVRSIGVSRGLARIEAPQGVFVLFSAGLGQRALDRLPGNDPVSTSIFTRHLIPALQTPGLSHVQIAKRVQQEVSTLARSVNHAQQPAYYDQIVGNVVLRAENPVSSLLRGLDMLGDVLETVRMNFKGELPDAVIVGAILNGLFEARPNRAIEQPIRERERQLLRKNGEQQSIYVWLDLVGEALERLMENQRSPADDKLLVEAAINAMLLKIPTSSPEKVGQFRIEMELMMKGPTWAGATLLRSGPATMISLGQAMR